MIRFSKLFQIATLAPLSVLVLACQNSEKFSQTELASTITPLSVKTYSAVINTTKNQPVTFSISSLINQPLSSFKFPQAQTVSLQSSNGTLAIVDSRSLSLKYTPNESYIGSDQIENLSGTDASGNVVSISLKVNIGYTVNTIQPALAVRGMSCITCHSSVASNIVTDYGYGNPWYFDTTTGDSFYYDRTGVGDGLSTLTMANASQIIVPKAPVPSAIAQQYGITSLAQFVQARFAQGTSSLSSQVTEIAELKINLPTAARIQQVFGNPTASQVYIPDTQSSPVLSGLNYDSVNKVFKISSLVCDGDLYLGATVVFDEATVSSVNGCRIYATGSIFVNGPLVSTPYQSSLNYNTQLLSATTIWVGTGLMMKNGKFCENDASGNPTGWYSAAGDTGGLDCTKSANALSTSCDSQATRAVNTLIRNTYSNAYPDATSLAGLLGGVTMSSAGTPTGGSALLERLAVETSLGRHLYDASCEPLGRATPLARLMMVAPYVNDRFNGTFSGSAIAEAAIMSLGTFQFAFDPVFSRTSVFSLLRPSELLSGQGL